MLNIRDFFVTLFFVGLGLQIPAPTVSLLVMAGLASLFLITTRFVSIFPILYFMRSGLRASLIPSINLSQMSEFSLVIAAIGLGLNHVGEEVIGVLTFVFAITSVLSTYLIQYNEEIQLWMTSLLKRIGFRDLDGGTLSIEDSVQHKEIVFLGFFREASSIFHEIELLQSENPEAITSKILVIDISPLVHAELNRRGVKCIYGDISSMDTLKHAHVDQARTVVCTIPNPILRGTTNERVLRLVRRLSPGIQVIVTASTLQKALELYSQGADFVFIPRIHSAKFIAHIIAVSMTHSLSKYRKEEIEHLNERREVLN